MTTDTIYKVPVTTCVGATYRFEQPGKIYLNWWAVCFQIYDPNNVRYEVPGMNISSPPTKAANPVVWHHLSNSPSFNFKVTRKSNGAVMWVVGLLCNLFTVVYIQTKKNYISEIPYSLIRYDVTRAHWVMESSRTSPNWTSSVYLLRRIEQNMEMLQYRIPSNKIMKA